MQEFTVSITEEFVEHLYDGALSIEVYGHPSDEGRTLIGRSLADRWSEVCYKSLPQSRFLSAMFLSVAIVCVLQTWHIIFVFAFL